MRCCCSQVAAVYTRWGTPAARALDSASCAELAGMAFAPGSMAPKVDAACRFVQATGRLAAIVSLGDAAAIVRGEHGTRVTP
jgi:carbamate kinase